MDRNNRYEAAFEAYLRQQRFAYVAVADLSTALARATSEGGEVVREPWDVPGVGRIAIINDNAGNSMGWMTPSQ